jgi:pimeloyl-ACP methyl ester carboxylesterase
MFLRWTVPNDARWLEINSYPLAFKDAGHGSPIVLVHGSIVDYRIWEPQFAGLGKRSRVIAPSLRHHFPETWDGSGDDYTIEQHASDIIALVKALSLGTVHLLGWSRGGLVAVEVARQAPEILRTLILEDATITLAGAGTNQPANEAVADRLKNLKANIERGDPRRGAQELVDALNGPGAWSRLLQSRQQIMLDNITTALHDVRKPVPREVFSAFSMPTLFLTGEKSPSQYALFYDELRKLRNFGPTVVIPAAAHLMHIDNATAFNEAVLAFVERQ